MPYLTPDRTYDLNGVTVHEKIIPDGTVWKNDEKAKKAGFGGAGALFKANIKLSGGTGRVQGITVHNTNKLNISSKTTQAEQYTRATFNENMSSARVHFFICDSCAWQNLALDEVSWHAGDGTNGQGNNTTLSLELIMDAERDEYSEKTKENGARIIAALMHTNGLGLDKMYTHTYFINKSLCRTGDLEYQNTFRDSRARKYCPLYLLPQWEEFKALVQKHLDLLKGKGRRKGDVNGDGVIDSKDYLLVRRIVLGTYKPTPEELWAADLDGKGKVTAANYLKIKRHILGTYTIPEEYLVK